MKWRHRDLLVAAGLCAAGALAAPRAPAAVPVPNGGGRPLWSPDGKSLAFTSGTPNTPANVWVLGVRRGSRPRQLTRLGARAITWAADGRSLYCQTMRDGRSSFRAVSVEDGKEHTILSFLPSDVTEVAFSPDRRAVAYLKKHDDHMDLWLASTGGREQRQLCEGLKVRSMDWSHDGRWISFDVGGVVGEATYVVGVTGANKPRLVFTGSGSYPSWSPDGSRIALLGFHAIVLVSKDGRNTRRLHVSQANRHALDWSPDSAYLAYTSVDQDLLSISMVNVSSGQAVRLCAGWAEAAFPRWSPDGRSVVFEAARRQDYSHNLYLLDVHRQRRTRLTDAHASTWDGGWSGDGEWIYAVSNAGGGAGFSLCRGAADGKASPGEGIPARSRGFRPILPTDPSRPLRLSWPMRSKRGIVVIGRDIWLLEGASDPRLMVTTEHPTWADLSPTGETLVYVKWQSHKPSLALLKVDAKAWQGGASPARSREEKELLSPPPAGTAYSHVAWSPQGKEIAFVRGGALCKVPVPRPEGQGGGPQVPATGGGAVSVLFGPDAGETGAVVLQPAWSPDGQWIAFGRVRRDEEQLAGAGGRGFAPQRLEVRMVSGDGKLNKLIASGRLAAEGGVYADPLADSYAWSPDGKWLAFGQEVEGQPAVYLVPATGGRPRLLRRGSAYPAWTVDGRRIAYTDLSGNQEMLRLMSINGREDRPMKLPSARQAQVRPPARTRATPGGAKGQRAAAGPAGKGLASRP